jgi:hypothetical protein
LTVASTAAAITEYGQFDAAGTGTPPTGGNLFIHATFDVINLPVGSAITFTCKAKMDQA